MSPKSLFTIIIKVLGLLLIFGLLELVPNILGLVPLLIAADLDSQLTAVIFSGMVLFIYFFLIYISLFKTAYIIEKLSLDKHFDTEIIEFNIDPATVLRISIIVLGGVILINAVPVLFKDIVNYLRQMQLSNLYGQPSFQTMVISGSKLLIGYLLMDHSNRISSWITRSATSDQV
jgi:hypothetical protein